MEIKKCPFCGNKSEILNVNDTELYVVMCLNCYAETNGFFEKKEAQKAWNQRTTNKYL